MKINPFSSLQTFSEALQQGHCSALDIANMYIHRINQLNERFNAYVGFDAQMIRQQACAADERRLAGCSLGRLDGLPIAVKDNFDVAGQCTAGGTRVLRHHIASRSAAAVERLQASGMVILGKTQMVEFAFGGWGINAAAGTPRNPWDLHTHRIPGGSSSGSAVAVAAGLAPAALGSDTGGSIRIPAALNGITGLKTSPGLISRFGVLPLSTTLDTVGPLTRTVEDAALLTRALSGADPRDSSTLAAPVADYSTIPLGASALQGLRIVVLPPDQLPTIMAQDVGVVLNTTIATLQAGGATIVEKRFPFVFDDLLRRNGEIMGAEAYALWGHFAEDAAAPMNPVARQRILAGKAISPAHYAAALDHMKAAQAQWQAWLADDDAMLTPTVPFCAPVTSQVDEMTTTPATFTRAANYFGTCSVSLPAGFSGNGLPIGMQFTGKVFDEATLIRIGRGFQHVTQFHHLFSETL